MSRTPLIAGNWKMNKTVGEGLQLVKDLAPRVLGLPGVGVAVCPPATALYAVGKELAGGTIALGAQDIFWEEKGAFTGLLSPVMLKDVRCTYVIIGHSERRGRFGKPYDSVPEEALSVFGDTDASVNLKVKAAFKYELVPIMCCGEMLAEREAERTDDVVAGQIREGLDGLSAEQVAGMVIAYEPVWAIGTGLACDAAEANRVCGLIRGTVREGFGDKAAEQVRIQYGGSVTDQNAHELLSQPEIDGALVGGASLDAAKFGQIVQAASVIAREVQK